LHWSSFQKITIQIMFNTMVNLWM